jgi:hypothetical protein
LPVIGSHVCVSVPQLPQGIGSVCPALHRTHTPFKHAGVAPEQGAPVLAHADPSCSHCCGCAPLQPSASGVQTIPPPVLVDVLADVELEGDPPEDVEPPLEVVLPLDVVVPPAVPGCPS